MDNGVIMIRKLILGLCLLTLCVTVSSAGIVDKLKTVIARQNVAAGGPDAWYYTIVGEDDDDYTTEGRFISDSALLRSTLTAVAGGSLTKVAFKLETYNAGVTGIFAQVYNSSKALIAGATGSCEITDSVGTWFEITLGTPYTIGSSELVYVAIGAEGDGGSKVGYGASGSDDHYAVTGTPSSWPDPIVDATIHYADYGIKIYVD